MKGNNMDSITFLETLATQALERLRALPQPVVRVCGPLTSGGYGYEENLRRFRIAEHKLKAEGNIVFDFFDGHDDEERIKEAGIDWPTVMEYYHKPLLASGYIREAYFMPRWRESNGANWEYAYLSEHTDATIHELTEEWLQS